jgi:hypothetical protein
MVDMFSVKKNIILNKQIAYTVDFSRTINRITYSQESQFENFFKSLSFCNEEIMTLCRHCVDMIIYRYGSEAYPTQYFEYGGFKFVAHYMDFGEDEDSIICVFWSLEEY